ncbi:MAG: tRNA1(Val) (adenine(37)-N6)-methyltransferase [Syntrophomonadaceae bacterium]
MSEIMPGLVRDDESLDDLIINGLKIIQPRTGYRFSLDSVILAHFADLRQAENIVDLGSGNGVIPLILSQRKPSARITGVEIQPQMVDRSRRSIQINMLADRVEILNMDIRNIQKEWQGGCADLVISNPPFWRKNEGKISNNPEEAGARHELNLTLSELVSQAGHILRPGGNFALIQRASRLPEIMQELRRNNIGVRRLQTVHSLPDKEAKQVLVEGQKGARSDLKILPPLIIYQQPGQYTQQLLAIYYG